MPTSLDPATQLKNKMRELDLSGQALSFLAGISAGHLSAYLMGTTRPDDMKLRKIQEIISGIEQLAKMSKPLPVDLRRVSEIKRLLEALDKGRLEISVRIVE